MNLLIRQSILQGVLLTIGMLVFAVLGCGPGSVSSDMSEDQEELSDCLVSVSRIAGQTSIVGTHWKGFFWPQVRNAWWKSCGRIAPYEPEITVDYGYQWPLDISDLDSSGAFTEYASYHGNGNQWFGIFSKEIYFAKGSYEFSVGSKVGAVYIKDNGQWQRLNCSSNVLVNNAATMVNAPLLCGATFAKTGYREVQLRVEFNDVFLQSIWFDWRFLGNTELNPSREPVPSRYWKGEYWDLSKVDVIPYSPERLKVAPQLIKNHGFVTPFAPDFTSELAGNPGGIGTNFFMARFTKESFFTDSIYQFTIRSDDGFKLFVQESGDDKPTKICEDWSIHATAENVCEYVFRSPGYHKVIVEYFEALGNEMLGVSWMENENCGPLSDPIDKCEDWCNSMGCKFDTQTGICVPPGTNWCESGSLNSCDPEGSKFFETTPVTEIQFE